MFASVRKRSQFHFRIGSSNSRTREPKKDNRASDRRQLPARPRLLPGEPPGPSRGSLLAFSGTRRVRRRSVYRYLPQADGSRNESARGGSSGSLLRESTFIHGES